MITIEEILHLHWLSIEKFGGSHGVRDKGLLESAVARPYQTFGGEIKFEQIVDWLKENTIKI